MVSFYWWNWKELAEIPYEKFSKTALKKENGSRFIVELKIKLKEKLWLRKSQNLVARGVRCGGLQRMNSDGS
jgi:hypothetical protein